MNKLLFTTIIILAALTLLIKPSNTLALSDFEAYTNTPIIQLCKCSITDYIITVENKADSVQSYSVTMSGSAAKFTKALPSNFLLLPNSKGEIHVFIDPECREGNYNLNFYIKTSGVEKVLKQKIIIEKCDVFDVFIEQENLSLRPGEVKEFNFSIKNKADFVEEFKFKFSKITSENFFIEPNQTQQIKFNISFSEQGSFIENLRVYALRTGYKKEFPIIVRVTQGNETQEPEQPTAKFLSLLYLKVRVIQLVSYLKLFWKYILAAVIILLIILFLLSIKSKKPEIEVVEKSKAAKQKKRVYYTSILKKAQIKKKVSKKTLKIILGVIVLIAIILLIVFFVRSGFISGAVVGIKHKIIDFFENFRQTQNESITNNNTGTTPQLNTSTGSGGIGIVIINTSNATNTTQNKTFENITINTTTNTTNTTGNKTRQMSQNKTQNKTETTSTLNFSALRENVSERTRKINGTFVSNTQKVLTSIRIFVILYLNYIIYGIVVLVVLILTLNLLAKSKAKQQAQTVRKRVSEAKKVSGGAKTLKNSKVKGRNKRKKKK